MSKLKLSICLACLLLFTGSARADRYYAVFFSHQDRFLNLPSRSHTWAVFARVTEHGKIEEIREINWFAADRRIGFFQLAETGWNREYNETIETALSRNLRVSMWGPFEIERKLFDRARLRSMDLSDGVLAYSMVDLGRRRWAPNCEHAVSDLRYEAPYLRTGFARGERGTARVARHLSVFFVDDSVRSRGNYRTHPWVAEALGLDRYPIEKRQLSRQR